jgi:hypothetical protein
LGEDLKKGGETLQDGNRLLDNGSIFAPELKPLYPLSFRHLAMADEAKNGREFRVVLVSGYVVVF